MQDNTAQTFHRKLSIFSALALLALLIFHIVTYKPITLEIREYSIEQVVVQTLLFLSGLAMIPIVGLVVGVSNHFLAPSKANKIAGSVLLCLIVGMWVLAAIFLPPSLSILGAQFMIAYLVYGISGIVLLRRKVVN